MKVHGLLLLAMVSGMIAGTSPAAAQSQRFDLMSEIAPPGWTSVPADAVYDAARGYGFDPGSEGHTLFSVDVPEGDYRVIVWPADGRPLTVWAESRRLMRQDAMGPVQFTVNVRSPELAPPPENAPGGERVRLKPREQGSASWDNRLTLGFDGPVARVEIMPVEAARLVLMGDSTVADQAGGDYASWGQMMPRFVDGSVSVANHAESGETLKSFISELRLDKALSQLRPGDVVLVQFGHNDSKAQWPQTYADAATTFRSYLQVYIDEIRRRNARPILVTSPHRRTFDPDGQIANSHGGYPNAVRDVAREQGVPLIDLTLASARLYQALGPDRAPLAFADSGRDRTHHNAYGAYVLAWAVADGLRGLDDPIAPAVTHGAALDPDRPPRPEDFTLHLPPSVTREEPAGS